MMLHHRCKVNICMLWFSVFMQQEEEEEEGRVSPDIPPSHDPKLGVESLHLPYPALIQVTQTEVMVEEYNG